MERTVLHKDGGNGAAAFIQLCLDDDALGAAVRIGLQLLDVRHEQDVFEQIRDAHAGQCGDGHADRVAAPFLGHQLVVGEAGHDGVGICARLIHLVDGDDDVNARRLGVVDRLDGLRHDAVVRGDHEDGDVGRLCASCAHRGERLVTRGVEEGDVSAVQVDAVCADGLRDAARLAARHIGVPDGVEQRGLAVVNVTHDADDGVARDEFVGVVLRLVKEALLDGDDDLLRDLRTELIGDEERSVVVHGLVERSHHAHLHEALDDLGRRDLQAGGQLLHRNLIRHGDLKLLSARLFQLGLLHALDRQLFLVLRLAVLAARVLLLQLLPADAAVAVAACQRLQLFVVAREIDRGRARIDDADAAARLGRTVGRGDALHLADRRGELLHRAALVALALVKAACALRFLVVAALAALKRLALEAVAEALRLRRARTWRAVAERTIHAAGRAVAERALLRAALRSVPIGAVLLRTVARRARPAALRSVAVGTSLPLRPVGLRACGCGARLFLDRLRRRKPLGLDLRLALRLGRRLCSLLGGFLRLGLGACLFRGGLLRLLGGLLRLLGGLRLGLRLCFCFLDSPCGSFLLPIRHDDNVAVEVRIET